MARSPLTPKRSGPSLATRIRSALRKVWYWYGDNRKQAKIEAQVRRGLWKCSKCRKDVKNGEFNVDHTVPCGKLNPDLSNLTEFTQRMFFGECTIMCDDCHRTKTNKENADRRKDHV